MWLMFLINKEALMYFQEKYICKVKCFKMYKITNTKRHNELVLIYEPLK